MLSYKTFLTFLPCRHPQPDFDKYDNADCELGNTAAGLETMQQLHTAAGATPSSFRLLHGTAAGSAATVLSASSDFPSGVLTEEKQQQPGPAASSSVLMMMRQAQDGDMVLHPHDDGTCQEEHAAAMLSSSACSTRGTGQQATSSNANSSVPFLMATSPACLWDP
jgi:hypothetical protein